MSMALWVLPIYAKKFYAKKLSDKGGVTGDPV